MSTIRLVEGSASSGNFGHAGRPGEVGGSASGSHIDRLSIDPNPRSFSNLFDKSLGPTSAALASNLGFPFTTEQANKATIHETGGIRFVGPYLSSVDAIDRAHVPNDPEFAKAIETETARMSQIPGMPKISAILSYKLEHGTAAMTMLNPLTGPDRQVMLFSDIKISSYATTANIMRGITKDGYVDDKVSSAKIVSVPHDFLTPNNATGWFATKSVATIIVDHEFGHAWMNANEGSEKAWLDAGKKDKETDANTNARISVYGAASVTENFAESFTHYVNGGPVKTMGAAKTAYLDAHFKDHVQHTPIRRSLKETIHLTEGSATSGNFAPDHVGRPGFVGGSGGGSNGVDYKANDQFVNAWFKAKETPLAAFVLSRANLLNGFAEKDGLFKLGIAGLKQYKVANATSLDVKNQKWDSYLASKAAETAQRFNADNPNGSTLYRGTRGPSADYMYALKIGDKVNTSALLPTSDNLQAARTFSGDAYVARVPGDVNTMMHVQTLVEFNGVRGNDVFASHAYDSKLRGENEYVREVILHGDNTRPWYLTGYRDAPRNPGNIERIYSLSHTFNQRNKESLVEAIAASKAKLTQQDAEFKSVLKRATRSHVFAIEADVLRYQRDLIFILDRRLNAIDNAKDDAGHLALILMSLAHDFERVGAKYLRTACDAGFKRLIDDLLARKILSKTYGVIRAPELIVQSVIAANSAYIRDSLTPDLHAKIHQSADGVTTAQKFKERIKLYGHYLWSAAEQSYSLGLDLYSAKVKTVKNLREGSASSGNFAPDHVGRPGEVGGSGNSGGNDLGLSKSAFDTKNKFGSDTGGVNDEWFSENKNTITAWYDNLRIQLPTKYLATLDGVAHASISASNPHVLDYTEKMKAAGSYDAFLKDYHGVNHDITLQVNADGKQQIYEGNARAQAAHNAGYANIPVRIIFVGGGERFWRPTDIPKSLREGSASSGNFAPDHVGRPGEVGGSGNVNGASSQPGEHVLKVSNAPGEHTIVINSVTDRVLEYNGSSKEPDIQNTLLSEIDKNINEIPAQVRQLNEVFFTDDMHAFSMVDGYTSMSNTTGVTLSNSPTVGFNTAVIASHVFGKGADFSVADVATSREQYSRLVADHEMGHVLYNTLGNNVKADWHELVGYFTKDTMKELSKYSATQPMEAFAEAYSKYVNNMSLAVSFKEFMRDNVKIGDHHLHESDVSIDQPIAFLCGFGDGPTYHVYKDRVEKFPLTITLTEGGSGSGNFDHAGRPGLRGGSAQGRDPVPIALRGLAASGGFSVSIHGVVPHQGYMIAGDISEETHPIVGGTQAGVRKAIVEFAGSHGRLLNKSERYIGGWVEKNQVVLDVSKRFAVGRSEALQIARSKDQIAVYKLGNPGKTIYTMSDKLRPSESKGKILESDRPDDGIAFIIAPGQNIEEAARKIAEAWGAKFNRK